MLYLGCHLSSAKGFAAMGRQALEIGANTFQFFTRNPRGGAAKQTDEKDVAALCALMQEYHFGPIIAHAPYTINPCAAKPETLEFARRAMREDLEKLELLPGCLYNFHPGSHVGQGMEIGIAQIVQTLRQILFSGQKTVVLLETMAGKGSEVGSRFEELAEILCQMPADAPLGVCLDTCHISDAGYDIHAALDEVLDEFERVIGLHRLRAIHLNDSLNPTGSRKDRHACLGEGCIGFDALFAVTCHPALQGLPFVLETPNDLQGYQAEIMRLRKAHGEVP